MMTKIKKILSTLLNVLLITCAVICAVIMAKNAMGKEPTFLGCRIFYIVTGSMEPTIPVGAAVLVHDGGGDYEVGDIITFKAGQSAIAGQPNTHRIIGKNEENGVTVYQTKGDANPSPDTEPVYDGDVYGKVIWSSGKMDWLGTVLGLLTTPLGFFSCIMLPIMLIAASMVKDFAKAYKDALEEDAREAYEKELAEATAKALKEAQEKAEAGKNAGNGEG